MRKNRLLENCPVIVRLCQGIEQDHIHRVLAGKSAGTVELPAGRREAGRDGVIEKTAEFPIGDRPASLHPPWV